MTPETLRQHYVDALMLRLTDAAEIASSVFTANHVVEFQEPPSLEETLEYADWSWATFVAYPLSTILVDIPVEPTDIDDVKAHFRMLARRKHVESIELMRRAQQHVHITEEPDDEDLPGGQYL